MPGISIIKTHQKINQCRFSTSGWADNGNPLSRLYMQIKILDQLLLRHIGKIHMVNVYRSVCLF